MTPESEEHSPPPARIDRSGGGVPVRVERSAGGVVIRSLEGRPHVLLIRDPYRKWGLPKGHLEEGEGPAEAAVREVKEETGLEHVILGPELGEIDWMFRQRGLRIHKYCRFYLMVSPQGECSPEEEEGISACRWLEGSEALGTISYGNARRMVARALERIPKRLSPHQLPWAPPSEGED